MREEGVALVKKFDGEFPDRFSDEIFNYLSINNDQYPIASKKFEQPIFNKEYYEDLADNFRSPHLWKWSEDKWQLRNTVFNFDNNQENVAKNWKGNIKNVSA